MSDIPVHNDTLVWHCTRTENGWVTQADIARVTWPDEVALGDQVQNPEERAKLPWNRSV